MKYHLKTHNDLDAVGTKIILVAAGYDVVSTSYHNYDTLDAGVTNYLETKGYTDQETLLLTDICPTQGICELIDKHVKGGLNVQVFDHHKTRAWANKYTWATIDLDHSGTSLVYEKMCKKQLDSAEAKDFVDAVTAWDLWQLKSTHRTRGEQLTSLVGFLDREGFVNYFVNDLRADLKEPLTTIIGCLTAKKERYITQVVKEQIEKPRVYPDGFGNVFRIIYASEYISEVAHAILDHPDAADIKYVCVINPLWDTCSLRSRDGKMDVGTIAQQLGGGGHPSASGFKLPAMATIEDIAFRALNSINY